ARGGPLRRRRLRLRASGRQRGAQAPFPLRLYFPDRQPATGRPVSTGVRNAMTNRLRIVLLAMVAGLFALAGCQKESASGGSAKGSAETRQPLMLPTSQSDEDWKRYIGQMVQRNVRIKRGIPPFAIYVSPDEDPAPVMDNARQTLQRGVAKDTI